MKLKDKKYFNKDVEYYIEQVIHSQRDRNVLKRKLIDGLTFSELADEFNLSEDAVKKIVYKGAKEIFRYIE